MNPAALGIIAGVASAVVITVAVLALFMHWVASREPGTETRQ